MTAPDSPSTDGVSGERAEAVLGELLAPTFATAAALAGVGELRAAAPLTTRAVKPRPARVTC